MPLLGGTPVLVSDAVPPRQMFMVGGRLLVPVVSRRFSNPRTEMVRSRAVTEAVELVRARLGRRDALAELIADVQRDRPRPWP